MIPADLERVSFRRHGRAHVIRTATRAPTEPIVFVAPSRAELVRMWADYLGGRP